MTLRLDSVSVELGGSRVVHGVSLTVSPGEWVAIIGPNGAGKSSLLRAVAGLVDYSGTIVLQEHDGHGRVSRHERARLVAYVPQRPILPEQMSVFDYALLGRTPHLSYFGSETLHDKDVTYVVLCRLGLEALRSRALGSLSGGEAQRVVLARALAQESPILLLDEPTTGLDLGHQQQVLQIVEELCHEDRLSVLSSMHDLALAGQYADGLVLLADGSLVACGSPAEVLTAPLIERHYDALVEIIAKGERRYVLPRRDGPARIGGRRRPESSSELR